MYRRALAQPGVVYRVIVNAAIAVVIVLVGCAMVGYGLLDIFAPSLTIRWQVRSTAKAGRSGHAVGMGFQRALGIDPDSDPWADPGVQRKVRWIGFGLMLVGLAEVLLGVSMVASN
jgi:hypothetical protein